MTDEEMAKDILNVRENLQAVMLGERNKSCCVALVTLMIECFAIEGKDPRSFAKAMDDLKEQYKKHWLKGKDAKK